MVFKPVSGAEDAVVACGQCIGCRLDRSRMWAFRIAHEASLHVDDGGNSFVTLTYRDKHRALKGQGHIKDSWSLDVEHIQKFMKRLRKQNPDRKIKYFHCGEYGDICKHGVKLSEHKCPTCNVGRPHYHMCLLNHSFNDLVPYDEKDGRVYYTSPSLEKLWGFGNVDVGDLNVESAGYTARYCLKKITGEKAPSWYASVDIHGDDVQLQPEYATMSNGIGKRWYEKYKEDLFPRDQIPRPGGGEPLKKAPRYFTEILRKDDPELYELIKEKRKLFINENGSEYTPERLYSKYRVKKAQLETLERTKV